MKKSKRGDAIIVGLLIGFAIGAAMLYIESGKEAQDRANATGYPVHQGEVIAENPGQSALTVFGPAVAGAGVGWALQEMSGKKSSKGDEQNNDVNIVADYGNVNVSITGNQDNDTETDSNTQSGDGWRVE